MREIRFLLHHDCPLCKGTEKNFGITVKELTFNILERRKSWLLTQGIYEARADDIGQLNSYADYIKEKEGAHMKILEAAERKFLFLTKWKNNTSPVSKIMEHGCLCIDKVGMENGAEIYRVLSEDQEDIGPLMDDIGEMGNVKILKIGRYEGGGLNAFELTNRQKEVIKIAVANGYYGYPRKVKLGELARVMKVSRSAFQKTIRKAERKVMSSILGDISV